MTQNKQNSDSQLWAAYVKDVAPLDRSNLLHPSSQLRPITVRVISQASSPTLDLHGHSLSNAHALVSDHVTKWSQTLKWVTVITGKSGQMKDQVPRWAQTMHQVKSVESLSGGGAYRLWFKHQNKSKG